MYTVTIRFQFFVSFFCQAKEKPQVEHVERPRGNIPFRLYLSYFKAGGNCLTLFLVLIFGVGAQVNITHLFFSLPNTYIHTYIHTLLRLPSTELFSHNVNYYIILVIKKRKENLFTVVQLNSKYIQNYSKYIQNYFV